MALSGRVREVVERTRRAVWKDSWTLFHTAPEVLPPDSDVLVYVRARPPGAGGQRAVAPRRLAARDARPDPRRPGAGAGTARARVAATAAARRSAAPPPCATKSRGPRPVVGTAHAGGSRNFGARISR